VPSFLTPVPRWSARAAPTLLAAAFAALYVTLSPRTGDLAAHVFRADLFGREGITVWNNSWYGGHHTPAYSVLFPPLAWALGPWLAGALGAVASAAAFEALARRHFGPRAWAGTMLFAVGTAATLFAGRLTFSLGIAVGLTSALALQRGRAWAAGLLAVTCSLASPVAGLFLALGCVALAATSRRRDAALVALAALAPPGLLSLAFPEGGNQPFVLSSLLPVPLFGAALLVLLPREQRVLRVGVALYAVASVASFLVPTPMGGNAVRLGQVLGPGLALCLASGTGPGRTRAGAWALLVATLVVWQLTPAWRDVSKTRANPSIEAAFYEPLNRALERRGRSAERVEIPFTREHWEAAEVAPRFPLARGWLRTLDIAHNPLFYEPGLDAESYRRWLTDNAVGLVALADAPLDYSARAEAAIVARQPAFLSAPVRAGPWRLFEVRGAHPLVTGERGAVVRAVRLDPGRVLLDVRRPGSALVRVRWSPYAGVRGGCVERAGRWTRISSARPGLRELRPQFALKRTILRGRRCLSL
jgi:hypothetical protein